MANRKISDVPQHETFPGPGPGRVDHARDRADHARDRADLAQDRADHAQDRADHGESGVHPVEQMVDAAIDRIAREYEATRDSTPAGAVVPRQRSEALARPEDVRRPARLRWKGHEVSEEFLRYAERVARGEDLPPFEGRILAEPNSSFPWDPAVRRRASRRALAQQVALWGSAAVVGALLAWTVSVKLAPPEVTTLRPAAQPVTAVLPNQTTTPAQHAAEGQERPQRTPQPLGVTATAAPRPADARSDVAAPGESASASTPGVEPAGAAPQLVAAGNEPAGSARRSSAAPPNVPARVPLPEPAPSRSSDADDTAVPVDIARPGALRDALGALLAARAANDAVPPGASEPSSSPAPRAEPPPAPPSGANDPAAAVTKEPAGESSGKESLLVETPSF